MIGPIRTATAIVLIGGALAGCASGDELKARINGRWGPEPIIQATAVDAASQNQALVLKYLEQNVDPIATPPNSGLYWYEVAQWGFNIGR